MSLIPVYRSRPSALHTARAGAGAAYCGALALAGALFLHPLVLAAALAAIVLAGVAAGVGREIGRVAALRAAVRAADHADQPARVSRGRHPAVPRRRGPRPADRHHARGDGRGRPERHARDRDRDGVRPAVRGRRPGRAAAHVPARVVPLGAHRDARHAARAGAGPRRRAHGRRRTLPPAPARPARGGAGGAVGRARPRGGRRGRARGARLLARRPHGAPPAAVVAPRLARGRRGRCDRGRRRGGSDRRAGLGGGLPAAPDRDRAAGARAERAAWCCSPLAPFAGRAARMGVAHA